MQSSNEIVSIARRWVGTPYMHGQRLELVGVDCVGLILAVGVELGFISKEQDEAFAKYRGYARTPNPRRMGQGMNEYLTPLDWPETRVPPDGSIGWFQWRDELPMHLAIVATFAERRTMIHAYQTVGKCVENTLDQTWLERVNSWWQFNGAEV